MIKKTDHIAQEIIELDDDEIITIAARCWTDQSAFFMSKEHIKQFFDELGDEKEEFIAQVIGYAKENNLMD